MKLIKLKYIDVWEIQINRYKRCNITYQYKALNLFIFNAEYEKKKSKIKILEN